ncbi:unnamed protein product, partial [Ectocarpus sp. 4 AP-2014]
QRRSSSPGCPPKRWSSVRALEKRNRHRVKIKVCVHGSSRAFQPPPRADHPPGAKTSTPKTRTRGRRRYSAACRAASTHLALLWTLKRPSVSVPGRAPRSFA